MLDFSEAFTPASNDFALRDLNGTLMDAGKNGLGALRERWLMQGYLGRPRFPA